MPEKDGIAALREIIELDPAARVIMCSALGQESTVLESIKRRAARRLPVPACKSRCRTSPSVHPRLDALKRGERA
jgi:DNA-binding NarL/FixJ family response regulator